MPRCRSMCDNSTMSAGSANSLYVPLLFGLCVPISVAHTKMTDISLKVLQKIEVFLLSK